MNRRHAVWVHCDGLYAFISCQQNKPWLKETNLLLSVKLSGFYWFPRVCNWHICDSMVTSVLQLKSQMVSFYLVTLLKALNVKTSEKCSQMFLIILQPTLSKSNNFHILFYKYLFFISALCITVFGLPLKNASTII